MKKFCFIIIDSLNRVPYLSKYVEMCNFKYDIVIWDRSATSQNPGAEEFYVMHYKEGKELTYIDKFTGYFKFSRFASIILKKNNYDGVFVFTPNVGMLCQSVLTTKYKGKFILDIRDYWQEKHKVIYELEKHLVNNSFANVISSRAYKKFLPKAEYIVTHNSQIMDENTKKHFRDNRIEPKNQIVIACIGAIKFIEYDKQVINYFANDNRFLIKFIGKGYDQLGKYCKDNGISNIYTEGMFPMSETFSKYEGVDMILNMYGNHNPKLDYALSNKLYFAAQLGKPIVVCKDTYMEAVAVSNGFGRAVDIDDPKSKDELFAYYNAIDYKRFLDDCDKFLEQVEKDEIRFNKVIQSFVNR